MLDSIGHAVTKSDMIMLTTQVAHLRMVFAGMFSTTFQDDDGEDEVLLHDPAVPEFSDEDYIRCIAARLAGQSHEEYRRIALITGRAASSSH